MRNPRTQGTLNECDQLYSNLTRANRPSAIFSSVIKIDGEGILAVRTAYLDAARELLLPACNRSLACDTEGQMGECYQLCDATVPLTQPNMGFAEARVACKRACPTISICEPSDISIDDETLLSSIATRLANHPLVCERMPTERPPCQFNGQFYSNGSCMAFGCSPETSPDDPCHADFANYSGPDPCPREATCAIDDDEIVCITSTTTPSVTQLGSGFEDIADIAAIGEPVSASPEWTVYIILGCMYALTVMGAVRAMGNKSGKPGNAATIFHVGAAITSTLFEGAWFVWVWLHTSHQLATIVSIIYGTNAVACGVGMAVVVRRAITYHVTGCIETIWLRMGVMRVVAVLLWLTVPETLLVSVSHLWEIRYFKGTLNDPAYHTFQFVMIGTLLLNGGGVGAMQLLVLDTYKTYVHLQIAALITTGVTILSRALLLYPFVAMLFVNRKQYAKEPFSIFNGMYSTEQEIIVDMGLDDIPQSHQMTASDPESHLTPLFAHVLERASNHLPIDMVQLRDSASDTSSNRTITVLEKY